MLSPVNFASSSAIRWASRFLIFSPIFLPFYRPPYTYPPSLLMKTQGEAPGRDARAGALGVEPSRSSPIGSRWSAAMESWPRGSKHVSFIVALSAVPADSGRQAAIDGTRATLRRGRRAFTREDSARAMMVSFATNILSYATISVPLAKTDRARELLVWGMRTGSCILLLLACRELAPWLLFHRMEFDTLRQHRQHRLYN